MLISLRKIDKPKTSLLKLEKLFKVRFMCLAAWPQAIKPSVKAGTHEGACS